MDEDETTLNPPPETPEGQPNGDVLASAEVDPADTPDPATQTATPPRQNSKVLQMPTNRLGVIKKEQRDRGRLEAKSELDAQAQGLGFENTEQMMAALQAQQASTTNSRQAAEPDPDYDADPVEPTPALDKDLRRSKRIKQAEDDNAKLLEDRRALNRARAHEARQRKVLQEKLDAQQAEHELRFAAMKAGITDDGDIDYAVNCLRRELKGKTAEDLKVFDENEFFAKKLRKQRPYLYGETTRDANSSPAPADTGSNGGAPPPETPGPTGGNDSQVDARKLPDDKYQELLRSFGLANPTVGMPG